MRCHPAVHILMPIRNVGSFIHRSLSSILSQDYRNITTLIIDDGSSDTTLEHVGKLVWTNASFLLKPEPQTLGIAIRRNQLVDWSRRLDPTSYFLWLDGDDSLTDPGFVSRLVNQMTSTRADVCLYNFEVAYENDAEHLRTNAQGLLADKGHSESILTAILRTPEQVVNIERYPDMAGFSSLGWTKAYAPSMKLHWPESDSRYIFEDFVYMAALFQAERITALDPSYQPIRYLRRASSATGNRRPEHFFVDVIQQLLTFQRNLGHLSPLKEQAARHFLTKKLDQYEASLRTLVELNTPGFSKTDLNRFSEARQVFD